MGCQTRSSRCKGCSLCHPEGWRGQGPAHKLPFRDLRRLGVSRRLGVRWVSDRDEQLDA